MDAFKDELHPLQEEFTKGYTYPDQRTGLGQLVESKFGEHADLSYRQRQAHAMMGPFYRVDHFLPNDVGSVAAFLASQPAHHAGRHDQWGLPFDLPTLPPFPPDVSPLIRQMRPIAREYLARPRAPENVHGPVPFARQLG